MTMSDANNQEYQVSTGTVATIDALLSAASVKKALEFIQNDHDRTLDEQKEICAISAPTFHEEVRGDDYRNRFNQLGLENVEKDSIGNVLGLIRGSGQGPRLVVAAHLDTVFPEGTDTRVKEKDGKFYAPGIADDTRGLAEILCLVRAIKESGVRPLGDILFCANVGEEGLGDLRGSKQLFSDHQDIDGFVSIDGTGVGSITYEATGSHRYRVTYKGPGGHSYGEFGLPSAIHAAGRAIAEIADLNVPEHPKTTFTVGTIGGGTSVNAIAARSELLIDIRSNGEQELLELEADILNAIRTAVDKENARWNSDRLAVDIELLGDRPAGSQAADEPIVQAAYAAGEAMGVASKLNLPGSTDANIPISLGIPAVAVGRGGESGEIHTVNEWFNPENAYLGPQKTLLTILSLVGVENTTDPLLKKRQS